MKSVYLDNASTTACYMKVLKEMQKYFIEEYGNPSSIHSMGEESRKAIDESRKKLAKEINAKPAEIVFTSGASEADNLAIFGIAKAYPDKKKIILSSIEHSAVAKPCEELEERGYEVKKIEVDSEGIIDLKRLEKEIDNSTLLVSVMHVNNVIGTVQPIEKIGKMCSDKGVFYHCDAAQSFGKLKVDVKKNKIDLLSASAHKIGGPKGVGFLFVREGIDIKPIIYGGNQEKGIRSGTENVPGIVGFSEALQITSKIDKNKIKKVRDNFIENLEKIGGKINGSKEDRIFNNVHVSFEGIDSEQLVLSLSDRRIYVSSGSACDSKKEDGVLKELGQSVSKGAIRISLNEETTIEDSKYVAKEILNILKKQKVRFK